jgi:hypothetical protein
MEPMRALPETCLRRQPLASGVLPAAGGNDSDDHHWILLELRRVCGVGAERDHALIGGGDATRTLCQTTTTLEGFR